MGRGRHRLEGAESPCTRSRPCRPGASENPWRLKVSLLQIGLNEELSAEARQQALKEEMRHGPAAAVLCRSRKKQLPWDSWTQRLEPLRLRPPRAPWPVKPPRSRSRAAPRQQARRSSIGPSSNVTAAQSASRALSPASPPPLRLAPCHRMT